MMLKNLGHLEAFYWIARLGSFRAAATHLRLTQPAISSRIRELERSMDTLLFERGSRPIQLTAQGRSILNYVERIFDLVDDVEARLAAQSSLRGQVTLGVFDSFALGPLANLLALARVRTPQLKLNLVIEPSRLLVDGVMSGDLDAAIVAHTHISHDLKADLLYFIDTAWAVPVKPGLAADEPLLSALEGLEVITQQPPSSMHTALFDWFAAASIPLPRITTCSSVAIIAHLIGLGVGASILPVNIVQPHLDAGTVRLVAVHPAPDRQPVFAIRQKNRRNRSVESVIDMVVEVSSPYN